MNVKSSKPQRNAYVVGAYIPAGGAFLAYQLGSILQRHFHFRGIAVTERGESPDHGVFQYQIPFPSIKLADLPDTITDDDVLIANPKFSSYLFSLTCKGKKVMYAQGFTTYKYLDCGFNLYVATSRVVQRGLKSIWDVNSEIINPYMDFSPSFRPPEWEKRPFDKILVLFKGDPYCQNLLLKKVQEGLSVTHRHLTFEVLVERNVPHNDFLKRLSGYRYCMTLSIAEGFGIIPLEAMAMGLVVFGFDGYGGQEYMKPGQNCATAPYPRFGSIVDQIICITDSDALGKTISLAAQRTAQEFHHSLDRFESEWVAQFDKFLGQKL
jgi:hypothetical protein